MPFVEQGAEIGSGLPVAYLIVAPDKIMQLKQEIEDERDHLKEWVRNNAHRLRDVPSPGEDECSKDTVRILSENGRSAIDALNGYINELNNVATGLHDSAVAYGLIEDENTTRWQQGPA